MLQQVGKILLNLLRQTDSAGRMGGEEFAIFLPKASLSEGQDTAERVRECISLAKIPVDDAASPQITVSIGIAEFTESDTHIERLMRRADKALYDAKKTGRNKICIATINKASLLSSSA